jgi:hypothetical protein
MALLHEGKTLSSVADILKCVNCTTNTESKEEMVCFKYYWERLLAKFMGSSDWGPSVFYYNTITGAKMKNDATKGLNTCSHEAILLAILCDKTLEKWQELYNWSQVPENRGTTQPNRGGKYTSTNKGQRAYMVARNLLVWRPTRAFAPSP